MIYDDYGRPLAADGTQTFHRLFGDVTGRKRVDATDVRAAKMTLGTIAGSVRYGSSYDFNQDGVIDLSDILHIAKRNGMIFSY